MGGLSLSHWLILLIIFLLFFGPTKLPQIGKTIGKTIRGFKQGLNEIDVNPQDIQDDPELLERQKKNSKKS